MQKWELFYDHYKETFLLIKDYNKERNKFFLLVVIIVGLQLMLAIVPDSTIPLIVGMVKEVYNIDILNHFIIVQSILWIVLAYFTMRYYQSVVYIERQYNYIHKLEETISNLCEVEFDRESKNYLTFYPKMSDAIDFMYKWVFPILYCFAIMVKIYAELQTYCFRLAILFDCVIFICCFVLTVLYLIFLHGKKQ